MLEIQVRDMHSGGVKMGNGNTILSLLIIGNPIHTTNINKTCTGSLLLKKTTKMDDNINIDITIVV
jgi:hypothetical protein